MTLEGDPCVDCIMTECEVLNTEMKAVFEHWAMITEIDNSADKGAYSFLAAYVCEDACVLDCTEPTEAPNETTSVRDNSTDDPFCMKACAPEPPFRTTPIRTCESGEVRGEVGNETNGTDSNVTVTFQLDETTPFPVDMEQDEMYRQCEYARCLNYATCDARQNDLSAECQACRQGMCDREMTSYLDFVRRIGRYDDCDVVCGDCTNVVPAIVFSCIGAVIVCGCAANFLMQRDILKSAEKKLYKDKDPRPYVVYDMPQEKKFVRKRPPDGKNQEEEEADASSVAESVEPPGNARDETGIGKSWPGLMAPSQGTRFPRRERHYGPHADSWETPEQIVAIY
jgi:hypothetical protein